MLFQLPSANFTRHTHTLFVKKKDKSQHSRTIHKFNALTEHTCSELCDRACANSGECERRVYIDSTGRRSRARRLISRLNECGVHCLVVSLLLYLHPCLASLRYVPGAFDCVEFGIPREGFVVFL